MKCEIPICTFQPNGCVLFRDYAIGDLAQVDPLSLSLSLKFFAKIDKTLILCQRTWTPSPPTPKKKKILEMAEV